jgi:hypothetical protein
MRWRGGGETRKEMVPVLGQRLRWSEEEKETIRRYYPRLSWNALQQMLPVRSSYAIKHIAKELRVVRPNVAIFEDTVPCVVHPDVTNTMAAYGFPLDGAHSVVKKTWAATGEVPQGKNVQRDQTGMYSGPMASAVIQMGSEQLALSVAPSAPARR